MLNLPPQNVERRLADLLESLHAVNSADVSDRDRKRVLRRLSEAVTHLHHFANQLDTVCQPPFILDPHHPKVLGSWISQAMLQQQRHPVESIPAFYGAGVYSLYYRGEHPAYGPIRDTPTPIYVGKADSLTTAAVTPIEQGIGLAKRLGEHAKSI